MKPQRPGGGLALPLGLRLTTLTAFSTVDNILTTRGEEKEERNE